MSRVLLLIVVVGRFVDLALQGDIEAATVGFGGLAQIDYFHDEVRTINVVIPPTNT